MEINTRDDRRDRRQFLRAGGWASLSALAVGSAKADSGGRQQAAYNLRVRLADQERDLPGPAHPVNNDEQLYPSRIGNFTKALPHNALGEVEGAAYDSLLTALRSERSEDFERIEMGLGRQLVNPQAGLAFTVEGPDAWSLAIRPAPAFASAEQAAEIAENYWMALLRDVPFSEYASNPIAAAAAEDLSRMTDFRGPKQDGRVTPATLFRDSVPGALTGPYLSQFFWLDSPFGAESIDRRMRTPQAGLDFLTTFPEWLDVQRGATSYRQAAFDPTRCYLRNGRDLGEWVHIDVLFQAYFNALLILFAQGAPMDGNNPYIESKTQIGFGTLGAPYIASLVCAVATAALKAVWFQKWFVHRRLRPEAFGGRIHNVRSGAANYPVHGDILNSPVLETIRRATGSFLLPQAFPEGSPTHPAYGAGHATVAGACVTVLKAFFDEQHVLANPVEASTDGTILRPYQGPDLTVGGELNKLASNVALGRNIAGVHWRSDATESLKLGEEVAIRYLRAERACFNEEFRGYSLTKFDGATVTV